MSRRRTLRCLGAWLALALILTICASLVPAAAFAAPSDPNIEGTSVILLDDATGQVLYEKNADEPLPPASLTKLMTLHIAYQKLSEGKIKADDLVPISKNAWASNPALAGSSLMFLEPGEKVTVAEVMKGIAIPSGNDASVALAEYIGGSVEGFVKMMNDEAKALGYKTMHFVDPHGLSEQNVVTAREYADFARRYIAMHPQSLAELHSQKSFAYPLWENLSPEKQAITSKDKVPTVPQDNRNGLLWNYEGCDGLKTGFIDQVGYNIALTAKRGEMRLVAVLLGVAKGADIPTGSARREAAGTAMLNWGYQNFTTVSPTLPTIKPVKVWKGAAGTVALDPERAPTLTVAKGSEERLTVTVHQEESVVAPVTKGQKLGDLIFAADGQEIGRIPLVATVEVKQGNIFKRLWDGLRLMIAGWFKK